MFTAIGIGAGITQGITQGIANTFLPPNKNAKKYTQPHSWKSYVEKNQTYDINGVPTDFDIKFEKLEAWNREGYVVGLGYMNGVQIRQDIDVMIEKQPDTFNLMLLALYNMQQLPESDPMSFFNIAAIHGYPKRPWNNVNGKILGVGGEDYKQRLANESGYCAHAMTQFPPWHRAHMIMFEQAVFVQMVKIAKLYNQPHRGRYLSAASEFRLPYWDYFRPRGYDAEFPGVIDLKKGGGTTTAPYDFSLPKIFTEEIVTAFMPPKNILTPLDHNPFHHFEFNDVVGNLTKPEWDFLSLKVDAEVKPLLNRSFTHRHPMQVGNNQIWDNPDRMNAALNELRMDANRYLISMISQEYYANYDSFSNMSSLNHDPRLKPSKKSKDTGTTTLTDSRDTQFNAKTHAWENSGSLEDFHNLYHLLLGGLDPGAHVSRVPIAAFDPAFWFHHGNIERIFSIWQQVNSEYTDTTRYRSNWFSKEADRQQKLLPFRKVPNGGPESFWTADELKDCTDFGYTYKECQGNASPSEAREAFEAKYRWSVPVRNTDSWLDCPFDQTPILFHDSPFFTLSGYTSKKAVARNVTTVEPTRKDGEFWEWTIDASVERLAMNGSFSILYYINDERDQDFDDKKNIMGPTLAGISNVFAAPVETCPSCHRQMEEGVTVDSSVAITSQLMDYVSVGQLKTLEYEEVKQFLIGHLRWRIVAANGERVDPRVMSTKKQLRIHVKAVKNHGRPINNEDPPEVIKCDSIVEEIIKIANRKRTAAEVVKQKAAVSANNPFGFGSDIWNLDTASADNPFKTGNDDIWNINKPWNPK